MSKESSKHLAKFEALVEGIRANCDKCKMDCRNRLQWLDSLVEALKQEREALAQEREALKAEREKLSALYQINLRVLNLINAPASKTGEMKNETDFTSRFTQ